jgi:NADPH-dependent 2,4-dienoyl-CoA reductase/sulfur reductase-like enzyme/rhodanese-related sulfurtransferase
MTERRHTVLIVGASAAGLRCACRLARLRPDWRIRVLEARATFSYAACGLPYVLSGDIADPQALRRTVYGVIRDTAYFAGHKGVEVLAGHRVLAIDTQRRALRAEGPDGECELGWDELVLATGARPRRLQEQPDHPRVVSFHRWDDLEPLRRGLAEGRIDRVAIVGAGPVGCELAEAFHSLWGAEVVLLEEASAPLPGILDPDVATCVAGHLRANGVELGLESPARRIEVVGERVALTVADGTVEADVAVVAVGVQPAVELAREAGIKLGTGGAIAVDERLATSAPHVWAAGDCAEVHHAVLGEPVSLPLGSLANRQGRTLAEILAGRPDRFPPVAGAVAVKVFDCNVAATGCTLSRARERGLQGRAAWITVEDRAHYWPEAELMHLKLVYETGSRRVLGVQAVGKGDAVKRVDVATQHIAAGGTLDDLAHVEHSYAPPYAPAMDPLAVAAQVAQNQEDGIEAAAPDEALDDGTRILDVRLAEESAARPAFPDRAMHVALGELSSRLDEIDPATGLVVCERGTRSAEAVRLLRRQGIRARYLGGGLRWRALVEESGAS